jgi:hypothetical protein
MCRQRLDRLIYNGNKFLMKTDPLHNYWTKKNPRPPQGLPNTGNYRGYYSIWEISDNSLYLINMTYRTPEGDAGLDHVFPNATGKVKATWYTGDLEIFRTWDWKRIYGEVDVLLDPDWLISIENGNYNGQSIKLITDYRLQKPEKREFEWFLK